MKPLAVVAVAGIAAGAFVGGRVLGARRHGPPAVDLHPPEEVASPPVAPPQPPSSHTAAPRSPALSEAPTPPESAWQRMIRDTPEAASRIHQAVIRVMDPRRRAIVWKRCAPSDSIGRSALLFRVDVEVRGDHLQVHGAHFAADEDGVELSADVGSCIANQLAGSDDVPLVTGVQAFVGQVEYRFTVDFGAPDQG